MGQLWRYLKTAMGLVFRHPLTGITLIPILPDGKMVLIRRRDTGQWGLPGGLIDWGEDIATAARRELEEETGLNLLKIDRLVGVYSAYNRDPRMHSLSILLETQVTGFLRPRDRLEVMDVQAFTLANLPIGNLSHDHDRQLQDYLKGLTVIA
jgi:8-oxo-dGTP diphosphatase